MNLQKRFSLLVLGLVAILALAACGGGSTGGSGGANDIQIGSNGEALAFDKTTLTAPANAQVTVTFKNNSSGQQHNWVLVKGGDDVAAKVDEQAAANGGSIQAGGDVIAATKLVAGGSSDSVTFTTPAAGTYTYLCTFPGHYSAGMKGTLTVQ